MNRTLKIGLIGFLATLILALLFKLIGSSPSYIAPLALPWGMVIIIGINKNRKT
jgi:hypothetical protein